jgi:proline dehydrogenase
MSQSGTEIFNNTEIAFSGKSDRELRLAHYLFRVINNALVVNMGTLFLKAAFKAHLPVCRLLKPTLFQQFIGGENLIDCDKTINKLFQYNIGSILDYSIEGKKKERDFNAAEQEILLAIEKAHDNPKIPFVVIKMSGILDSTLLEKTSAKTTLSASEKTAFENGKARLERICHKASDNRVRLLIDAEESWYQTAIDALCTQMMEKHNKHMAIVFCTMQMYRQDRVNFLKEAYSNAVVKEYRLGVKLVRGAYMEKERKRAAKMGYPSPIHFSKKDTDQDYHVGLRFCIKHINRIALCAGTHNQESAALLMRIMEEIKLNPNHDSIHFAQLLGMSDTLSFNLAAKGYNVAKYVPYGPIREVFPYLMRRAQENTAVVGQMSRELSLVKEEIERRKKAERPSLHHPAKDVK